ncbi:MAG: rod shape-determining protein MreD [Spirochaetaceae bacterium 4572_59]|nr:MAG: rod shape-determining protein MreD [Spirochaetaceae bacterium 4572_59]
MKRQIVLILLLFAGILIQTTILNILPLNISPDLSMIMLVYFSIRYGSATSQVSGFASGLMQDFVSLSPLGFNCFIKTVLGFLTGFFHERLIMDPIIFPIFSVSVVTIFKGILQFLLIELFSIPLSAARVFSSKLLMEILINALLAPIIFQFLKILLDRAFPDRKTL